jgi:hypothetical protein
LLRVPGGSAQRLGRGLGRLRRLAGIPLTDLPRRLAHRLLRLPG